MKRSFKKGKDFLHKFGGGNSSSSGGGDSTAGSGNALTPNAASSSDGASGGGGGHSAANAKLQGEELRGDIKKRLLGELEIDPMREMQR